MKKFLLRATGIALSLLTVFNFSLPCAALYRGVLGDVYSAHSRQVGAGVDFTVYQSVTDGLNETAYLFEYRPGEGALPLVSWGDSLMGSNRVTTLAKYESDAGLNVIGGINGDFYSVYTGIPMGAVIREGRIISDDDKNNAVGFTYDGETLFGAPGISFSVIHTYEKPLEVSDNVSVSASDDVDNDAKNDTDSSSTVSENEEAAMPANDANAENANGDAETAAINDTVTETESEAVNTDTDTETELTDSDTSSDEPESPSFEVIREELPVSYFNKYPTEWGAYLVDEIFADSTRSTKPSLEIVIKLDSPDMYPRAGGTMSGTVTAVNHNATNTPIESGCIVISVCETSSYRANYFNVGVGDRMDITFTVASGWENVRTAIGGSDIILDNGVINTAAVDEYHEKVANPRTAVGVREDGTVIFFAVDGRSNESYGMRIVSLAETLKSFGCVYAMNLDGGGSTTAVVKYPGDGSLTLANVPSDSAERAVSNALLLVDTNRSDGIPKYIIPNETDPIILPGESYTFEGDFYDSALVKVDHTVFGENDGETVLPDVKISFDQSRLSYYNGSSLPNLGTISEDGKTYTADGVTGEIPLLFTAEYGNETLTGRVILFVAPAPDSVDISLGGAVLSDDNGFEIKFDAYYMNKPVPARPEQLTYSLNDHEVRAAHTSSGADNEVKLADSSIGYITEDGRFVPYSDADGSAWLTVALDGIPMSQTLVIYNSPYVTAIDSKDIVYNFETSTETSVSENISFASDLPLDGAKSLDLYAADCDLELYATVIGYDGNERRVSYTKQVNEPVDNGIYHYRAELDGDCAQLAYALVIDSQKNIGKSGSLTVRECRVSFNDTETVFYDTYNHWARENINALYRQGIVGGEEYGGKLRFAPDRSLSRAEFAVMICRSLGYDINSYTEDPGFDDISSIPEWALPYVRAVSANKIMNGKDMPNGTLCFDASGQITRQEIMQVIGNIIKLEDEKALIEALSNELTDTSNDLADLSAEVPVSESELDDMTAVLFAVEDSVDIVYEMPAFSDAGEIAAWAYENVLLTLETGIITGYEDNTLRPTRNVTRAEAATVILRALNYLTSEN